MKPILKPKTQTGPESSLREFPLLYLFFDDFTELKNAYRAGAFELGMHRDRVGIRDYNFEELLKEEKRFLDYYRDDMVRIRLNDGTMLYRGREIECWDKILYPEKYAEKPFEPTRTLTKPEIELRDDLQKLSDAINAELEAMRSRYGISKEPTVSNEHINWLINYLKNQLIVAMLRGLKGEISLRFPIDQLTAAVEELESRIDIVQNVLRPAIQDTEKKIMPYDTWMALMVSIRGMGEKKEWEKLERALKIILGEYIEII